MAFICLFFTLILESDGELFEFNPEEYIRKDIEGSGKCYVFVKNLC